MNEIQTAQATAQEAKEDDVTQKNEALRDAKAESKQAKKKFSDSMHDENMSQEEKD